MVEDTGYDFSKFEGLNFIPSPDELTFSAYIINVIAPHTIAAAWDRLSNNQLSHNQFEGYFRAEIDYQRRQESELFAQRQGQNPLTIEKLTDLLPPAAYIERFGSHIDGTISSIQWLLNRDDIPEETKLTLQKRLQDYQDAAEGYRIMHEEYTLNGI